MTSEKMFGYLVESAVKDIAVDLVKHHNLSEKDALREVYHSDFYQRLQNRKSALFGESSDSLIHLYQKARKAA